MSLTAAVGSVTVNASGVASGGGLARALYDSWQLISTQYGLNTSGPAFTQGKQALAAVCNAQAAALLAWAQQASLVIPADALDGTTPALETTLPGPGLLE